MARARLVSVSLGSSRKFREVAGISGELGDFAQILFVLLVINADDFGLLEADAPTIKMKCFPATARTEVEIDRAVSFLWQVDLIRVYEVEGDKYLQIVKFEDHQAGLHKRTKPKFPLPPPGNSGKFREIPASRARAETNLNRIETKGNEVPPSAGAKREKAALALAPRARNPLSDCFEASYLAVYSVAYQRKTADFVQLAKLRKLTGFAEADWPAAVDNYLATPQSSHTLADLAGRYAVFRTGPLDRYAKPLNGNGKSPESLQSRRLRELEEYWAEEDRQRAAEGNAGDTKQITASSKPPGAPGGGLAH